MLATMVAQEPSWPVQSITCSSLLFREALDILYIPGEIIRMNPEVTANSDQSRTFWRKTFGRLQLHGPLGANDLGATIPFNLLNHPDPEYRLSWEFSA